MPAVFPEIPVGTGFRHQSRIPPRLPEESRQSYARDNWRRLDQGGETGRTGVLLRGFEDKGILIRYDFFLGFGKEFAPDD